jgi:hypothetical protein
MDLIIREGVQYDLDGDGDVTNFEKQPISGLRLRR